MNGSGLRRVAQVAYVVDDLEAAAWAWHRRVGAGPFLVRHHPPMTGLDGDGREVVLVHTCAYGQWGDLQLELVLLRPGTSPGLADLMPVAATPHHLTWFAADLTAELGRLAALGWPAVLTARTSSGLRFAFVDARRDLGHLVELYQPHPRLRALYDRVAAAADGWDGSRLLREM